MAPSGPHRPGSRAVQTSGIEVGVRDHSRLQWLISFHLLYLRTWSEVRSHHAQALNQILNMADSDSEWWEELLVVEPTRRSAPAPVPGPILPDPVPVLESLMTWQSVRSMPSAPAPGQILLDLLPGGESLMSLQSVRSMPSAPAQGPILQDPLPIVESLLSVQSVCSLPSSPAPVPILQDPMSIVESLLSVQSVCSMPSAPAPGPIVRDPVLQPAHRSTAILLPIEEPSLGRFIVQTSTSIPAASLQAGVADAADDARIRARWWQSLVPNGLAVSIAREHDIVWRLPRDEPQSLAEWRHHCEHEVRSISRSHVFYIGITDNPAHRWQMHSHSGAGWSTMFVIAVAANSRTTGQLERHLIDMFRNPLTCTNIGRGAECSSYGSPHFVYTVFRTDGLLRRSSQGSRSRSSRGSGRESFTEFLEASRRGG